ncbi:hypothetical protein [Streptomyces fagopyri]|uniref:hypothetical protein n=1 Tax=Streptomyces fagopyri TaxID=2662397 RepID=UPI0038211F52
MEHPVITLILILEALCLLLVVMTRFTKDLTEFVTAFDRLRSALRRRGQGREDKA